MKKSDVIIELLIVSQRYASAGEAKDEVIKVFKELFPASDFKVWDEAIDQHLADQMLKQFSHGSPRLNIKYLIRDVDHVLERV